MKLLAMLFASLLHWRTRPPLAWPARWQPAVAPGVAPLLALSLGPALAAALLLWLCGGWLWGLLGLALQTSVLCGCLGGTDRRALFDSLIADGERGDLQAALHALDELGPVAEVADDPGLCRTAAEVLALRGVREWFAVLFWFALLGAPGALLYRCLERVAAASGRGRGALAVLEWPALRAFGLVTALAGRPGRVLGAWADTLFASGSALRAFVDGAAGRDAVLVLKHSEFANLTIPVQPGVREVDDGYLFEAIRFVSGRDEPPRPVVVDPEEQVVEMKFPGQFTGVDLIRFGLPRRPVMTLHHWIHILWVNQMAGAYEARTTPVWKGAPRILWALLRAHSINRWNVLGKLSRHGKRCDIHPTAIIEGSELGDGVTVGPHARVLFSRIGDNVTISSGANIELSVIGEGVYVSPNSLTRFSVIYPGALAGFFMQLSVMGRGAITSGASIRDLNVQQDIRVELDGALHSTKQRFLGSAFGHRCQLGGGVSLAPGRAVPNDYLVIGDTEGVLSKIPPGLADMGPLLVVNGTLRPMRETAKKAVPEAISDVTSGSASRM